MTKEHRKQSNGMKQAKAYCTHAKILFSVPRSPFAFKFGNEICESMGTLEFCILFPINNIYYLSMVAHVAIPDVPLLIGLDYLDKHAALPDNIQIKLICEDKNWEFPAIRRNGQVFIDRNFRTVLFTNV